MEDMVGILIDIRSSQNVGSMFRTADAVGVNALYLCGITPAPVDRFGRANSNLTKASLGAEKTIEWQQVDNAVPLLNKLKKEGCLICALEQDAKSVSLDEIRISDNREIALVVGNEVTGLPAEILAGADMIVEIPMRGAKESLNVAVSFGIAAYELQKISRRHSELVEESQN